MLISILVYSCVPPESYSFVSYTISNNSNHEVNIEIYYHDYEIDSINLIQIGSDTIFQGYQEGQVADPPPFLSDSVRITYDDSISIMHYRTAVQTASRSILLNDSWTGGKVEEYRYEWEYIFTDADYLEALENQ